MTLRPRKAHLPLLILGLAAFGAGGAFGLPYVFATNYERLADADLATSTPAAPAVTHLKTPPTVRGVYMTECVAGTPSFRDALVKFVESTELNSVVVDIKDYSGTISFPTDDPLLKDAALLSCGASDMKEFVESLHAHGIYVIGRITVFQDPHYATLHPEESVQSKSRPGEPWKDYKGLSFVSVASHPFWDYIVELSKASYALGFDELNYDYIRWPSDGPMSDIVYPSADRAGELEKFWQYLSAQVKPTGAILSADLFGYVTVHTDDLGIGQILERALPYFDYVDPMVYPSHYNSGFEGLADVNSDPYKVVYASLISAVARAEAATTTVAAAAETPVASTTPQLYEKSAYPAAKIRPWLQAFDYPVPYTPAMVAAQVRAAEDAGLASYLFWDASNHYTSLRAVLAATST